MKSLSPELVAKVTEPMKGKKLEKLMESIAVINESLLAGGWAPRGSVKASSGFYQGYVKYHLKYESGPEHDEDFSLRLCLSFGGNRGDITNEAINRLMAKGILPKKITKEHVKAWVDLCLEASLAREELDNSRPRPIITEIGLSPRVTATLKEMNLNIDLPSIKLADIAYRLGPKRNKQGEIMLNNRQNASLLDKFYYVNWTPGTKHRVTRFSDRNCNCEACGKHIPSGRFVPIEADDAKLGHVGMYIGCDCAANIFGIKDAGLGRA